MNETLTAADFAATLGDMIRAAELGGVEWAGPIENVDEWLAGNQQRTDEHGDAGLPGYCVQSSDGEVIVAFTGTGPHAAAYAELIAYLLNNVRALTTPPVPAGGEHPEARCQRCGGPNIASWHAPSPLWNGVMRDPETGSDRWSIVCPVCFAALAAEAGLDFRWHFGPHADVSGLWSDRDGREWDGDRCLWVVPAGDERERLTEASERLIRDWDQHPDAIDANELSARLWLIEKEARRGR